MTIMIIFQMLESDETQKNNSQLRILKLLQDLKTSQHKTSNNQTSNSQSHLPEQSQIAQFQKQLQTKFEILNQKVDTAIAIVNQVARQRNQRSDVKRKIRLTAQFEDAIEDVVADGKDWYERMGRKLEEVERRVGGRVMDVRVMMVEKEEKSKHQLAFCQNQILVTHLDKLKKYAATQQNDKDLREMQFRTRIKNLRREIAEDRAKNKSSVKKIKNSLLTMLEKTVEDIQKEQETMKESFELHVQTLQKIIASVSDKIQ